ncbi:MAG: Ig-like domain-containing protein [Planctomycetes bacterium]|nr:Ig-like domain-containing protein [Planctomycetota bacterium]
MRSTQTLPWLFLFLLGLAACDNVGRAFDRDVGDGGGGGGTTGPSTIQVVPAGGDVRDGRPRVRTTAPRGGGWPTSVPIVIEFSESMNEASIKPTRAGGTDGKVIVRLKGTTTVLPALYDFVADGRMLVLRPTPALTNAQDSAYEVVLLPGVRDADGTRFQVETEEILAEFTVDEDAEQADGRILAVFPRDNVRDAVAETAVLLFFTKAPNAASVSATTFQLRGAGGARVLGDIDLPLAVAGIDDPRIIRFTPENPLAPSVRHEVTVTDGITFGESGVLDFSGRTPFARFDTVGVEAPTAVDVANFSPGFPGKVNLDNLAALQLKVTLPATAAVGDRVVVRVYGGDRSTTSMSDQIFVERLVAVATAGAQDLTVDFAGALGSVERPKLDDGSISLVAQLRRGDQHSGFAHAAAAVDPRFDVTRPTLRRLGPPGTEGGRQAITDQDSLVLFGTASEEIGVATLTDGAVTVNLFASASDGRFAMLPLPRAPFGTARNWSLLLTDKAGNQAAGAESGPIVLRGFVAGTLPGTLAVEIYDDATLLPLAGTTVVVDPDAPTVPPTDQQIAVTDADGRASFAVASATATITAIRNGYHLRTLYRTTASSVSLPLRPQADATATFRGTAVMAPTPNVTALVGHSGYDEPLTLAVNTTSAAATAIPSTPIRPNRPQIVTALAGVFEPTALPAFTSHGCQQLGATLLTLTPPAAPATPGQESNQSLTLLPATGTTQSPLAAITKNFALATGLDTDNLVGGKPLVRATLSLSGFGGQVLFGTGFASVLTGASYNIQSTYSLALATGLTGFGPVAWIVSDARDTGGRVSRVRTLVLPALGIIDDRESPPGVPVITAPAGPFTVAPAVTFADQLAIDTGARPGFLGRGELLAQDADGRQWTIWYEDADAAGGMRTVQFPDLAANQLVRLRSGNWSLRADARLFLSLNGTTGSVVLAEVRRMEITYARSATVSFTVQ